MTQAEFTLRTRNPDVLTCIANLSNDEVFTPPELAKRMLDSVEREWAQSNGGSSIWSDPTVTFLDPFTKSGVFLREITRRLVEGLEPVIPDLADRVDHVLSNQVYGIGITALTGMLARRSLYCSKWANGEHSIARSLATEQGNIWFEPGAHAWSDGRCRYCGASRAALDRGVDKESYAYALIHTDDARRRVDEIFGAKMEFDVIVGNPPFQMGSEGSNRTLPLYNLFVDQAKHLSPRLIAMIIPSRWMASGLGLGSFRNEMLNDSNIRELVDFPDSSEVFPSVDIKSGVCYFLWSRDNPGACNTTLIRAGEAYGPVERRLNEFDVLVRDNRALPILHKVLAKQESSIMDILAADKEFGLTSNFSGYSKVETSSAVPLYAYSSGKRVTGWVERGKIGKSAHLIDTWKVLIPAAGPGNSGGHTIPDIVLGSPRVAPNPSVCTQTYLFVWVSSEAEATSVESYVRTRFFRFLISLRKVSQHATRSTYTWVPQQTWDREWTDADLYEMYGITDDEAAYIETMIRPMDAKDE